jgi:hypothetical protein
MAWAGKCHFLGPPCIVGTGNHESNHNDYDTANDTPCEGTGGGRTTIMRVISNLGVILQPNCHDHSVAEWTDISAIVIKGHRETQSRNRRLLWQRRSLAQELTIEF